MILPEQFIIFFLLQDTKIKLFIIWMLWPAHMPCGYKKKRMAETSVNIQIVIGMTGSYCSECFPVRNICYVMMLNIAAYQNI